MTPTPVAPLSPGLTETLANLNIFWILAIVAGLTVLRVALVSLPSPTARSWAEVFESGMIAVALVFLIIRPFVLQAFYIPSPSMEPTLLGKDNSGDRILVNKFGYRVGSPRHDDVVVFLAPPAATVGLPDDSDFIKRLIGLPGDRIEVHSGYMTINGRRVNHPELRRKLASAGLFGSAAQALGDVDQADHHAKYVADGVLADGHLINKTQLSQIFTSMDHCAVAVHPGYVVLNGTPLSEPFIAEDPDYDLKISGGQCLKHDYGDMESWVLTDRETSPGEFRHLSLPEFNARWARPTEPLPAKKYLMMGDNRNDSKDGTAWGPLDARRVVGRAQFIFWPPGRIGAIH